MSNGASQKNNGERAPAPMEALVWMLFAVALVASLYVLMREPEDGAAAVAGRAIAQARMLAVAASVVGAACGVWRVMTRGGEENLFGVAVLFNVILGCFWILRMALEGSGGAMP